jgi:dephospho-CoA kinase
MSRTDADILLVGLTGSIGMGKSTAAARFLELGIPVFDSDREVHRLYAGAAVPLIEQAFPGTTKDGKVDRSALSATLLSDPSGFERLERIVHPLVRSSQQTFLRDAAKKGEKIAILEVPLLFETGLEKHLDLVVVVSAPADTQRQRVLARPGMTEEKLQSVLARQLPDTEKCRRADYVVDTSGSLADTHEQVDRVAAKFAGCKARAYARHWQ